MDDDGFLEAFAARGDMCKQLEQETEIASWTENGGLFVGTNAERLAEYRRFAETGKYFGIESHVLSLEEGLGDSRSGLARWVCDVGRWVG